MKQIVVTGPESTGKTTLAQALAQHYQTSWAEEYARIYLNHLPRPYQEEDLLHIAKGQLASEEKTRVKAGQWLICDTSLEVIKIWSEVKYGRCHPWILERYRLQKAALYLLCAPDIPWQYDLQRENPLDRNRLFMLYQQELRNKNYIEIRGGYAERLDKAIQAIDSLLK